jgi:ectoine hydroxylase-related dioxygenase (phytanoyl-CoA dioxygenase family)
VSTPWGPAPDALRTSEDVEFRSQASDGPDADSCAARFLEEGYLFVDDILAGDALAEAQSAYRAALEPERLAWADAVAAGEAAGPDGSNTAPGRYNSQYFDLPRIVEQHGCFLDIVTHPRLVSVLERVVGPDVQILNVQCRNYPAQELEVAEAHGAYSGWHNDRGYGVLFENARTLHVVVIFTFFDVDVDGGCTAVVPGSHLMYDKSPLLGAAPPQPNQALRQLGMPGAVAANLRAGSAVIFDERTLHSALPNVGGTDRCTITTRYAPFWVKQTVSSFNTFPIRLLHNIDVTKTSSGQQRSVSIGG